MCLSLKIQEFIKLTETLISFHSFIYLQSTTRISFQELHHIQNSVSINHIPHSHSTQLDLSTIKLKKKKIIWKISEKIICYFGSWAVYRPGNGKIDITKINPHLCTHLVYTFVGLNSDNNNIAILDAWADLSSTEQGGGLDGFNKFNQLRGVNPSLKTLIAIGGWNQGSAKYSNLVANASSRKTFIENAIKFVRKYGFDGLDFDWEYPNQRGGVEADKENYILLLKELRVRFDQEGLILSAAVGAVENSAKQSYNIAEVAKYLHFVNLMAYDMHGIWNEKTGNNAPLYAGSWETGEERLLNVVSIIKRIRFFLWKLKVL